MSFSEKSFITDVYIDISSVGDKKVAVYPNYLIFGKAIFDSHLQRAKFNEEASIKINERAFEHFLQFLSKAISIYHNKKTTLTLIHSDTFIPKDFNLEEAKNCLYYNGFGEKEERTLIITSTYNTPKVSFELNYKTYIELYEAFSNLFFKSYCYSPIQNIVIEHFVNNTSKNDIEEQCLKTIITNVKRLKLINLTANQLLRLSTLIVRHRKLLCLWHKFCVLKDQITEKEASVEGM